MMDLLSRYGLVLGLVLGGCDGGPEGHIQFDNLQVGQRSSYAVLMFSPFESSFEYVDGVLVAEIIDHDASGFRVREAFASPDEVDERVRRSLDAGGVREFYLSVDDGVLRVTRADDGRQPRLLSWLGTSSLELKLADVTRPVVDIAGWKATSEGVEAAVVNGKIRGATYPLLNVVKDSATAVDGPALTRLYQATTGLVRSTSWSYDPARGLGFDLIAD
jgi:hypothetical protein